MFAHMDGSRSEAPSPTGWADFGRISVDHRGEPTSGAIPLRCCRFDVPQVAWNPTGLVSRAVSPLKRLAPRLRRLSPCARLRAVFRPPSTMRRSCSWNSNCNGDRPPAHPHQAGGGTNIEPNLTEERPSQAALHQSVLTRGTAYCERGTKRRGSV